MEPYARTLIRTLLKVVHRTVGPILPPTLLALRYPPVPGKIHVDDQMLGSLDSRSVDHYLRTGREAVSLLEWAVALAGHTLADMQRCLLLPSGYGRVLRHLVTRLDATRITVCDIDPQAVRFCANEFGVTPLRSTRDLKQLVFPVSYDLIFIGSLLTHLPPEGCGDLLESVSHALQPHGHLIFTTQGESCLSHLEWYGTEFARAADDLTAQVRRSGVGFLPYRRYQSYGITIHARTYVERFMTARLTNLRLLGYKDRGWDAHQDVWSYVRAD
jgi:SAM-dependent methyltransferase